MSGAQFLGFDAVEVADPPPCRGTKSSTNKTDPPSPPLVEEPVLNKQITVVKIGGAAITHKQQFETVNEHVLSTFVSQVKTAWTELNGALVLVHGAGSYGHFQAKSHRIQNCDLTREGVRVGFSETRLSVTQLNLKLVEALVRLGIPAVGVPALPNWLTTSTELTSSDLGTVDRLLERGFLPVMHGDGVLDHTQGCAILSGDTILRELAINDFFETRCVVFMTNVMGVYDRPPPMDADVQQPVTSPNQGTCSSTLSTTNKSDYGEKFCEQNPTKSGIDPEEMQAPRLMRHIVVKGEHVSVWFGEYTDENCPNEHTLQEGKSSDKSTITTVHGAKSTHSFMEIENHSNSGLSTNTSAKAFQQTTPNAQKLESLCISTECTNVDATGGMNRKIAEAALIARAGVPVIIVKAGTKYALDAVLRGKNIVRAMKNSEEWVTGKQWNGTVVSSLI
eukprot:CFRG4457T1